MMSRLLNLALSLSLIGGTGALLPMTIARPAPVPTEPDRRQADPFAIPDEAWSRPIGEPIARPSRVKTPYPMVDDGPRQGAPLGGIGAGTFSRTYAGDFARWHLDTGHHVYGSVPSMMFSVYTHQGERTLTQALWTGRPSRSLSAWQWDYPVGAGTYYALYPRSWFVYDWDALPVELAVEQFSPVIPHNYRESSYPIAIFTWRAHNPTSEHVTLGLMFTTPNLLYPGAGHVHRARAEDTPAGRVVGVEMTTAQPFEPGEGMGSLAISALELPGVSASVRTRFLTAGDGADIWADFSADGRLDDVDDQTPGTAGEVLGAGVAATVELAPGETRRVAFALAWDMPVMTFGPGEHWYKRYTAFYGRDGNRAWDIARDGLRDADAWRQAIVDWQAPILADESRPAWYKTALFNELYFIADGGTAWEHGQVGDPPPADDYLGRFAYIECFDYPYYNTFDVDFYASFALLELWPDLEINIMRDFAAAIPLADETPFIVGYSGTVAPRKLPGAVPHDLGAPSEAPWKRVNAFTWQDTNRWKDLNAKFALRLYRDVILLDRPDLAAELWPAAVDAIDYLAAMDADGDGIPENEGVPDQTYDTWPVRGISAYSGGLWIAALAAMRELALLVGDEDAAASYAARFEAARTVYEDTLWTGRYYAYDADSRAIMADQLAGEWYASISGLEVLPASRVDAALRTIYDHNVRRFQDGLMGAVNGIEPDGSPVRSEQAEEVWTGTTYMLAAHMLFRGLDSAAWATAYGIYRHTYETGGLWFRTPEAWDAAGNYRAGMYMRPLAVWAIETALARRAG